jgi:acid phosphatase family membrane protein YuiD
MDTADLCCNMHPDPNYGGRRAVNMNPIQLIERLLANPVLMTTGLAWLIAQGTKMILEVIKGNFHVNRLTGAGGMPSSHTATVCSLAISSGIVRGFDSTEFAIALILAIIVISDALSVRAEAGKHARILNRLRERELQELKPTYKPLFEKPLKEQLGHTLPQVIVGGLIGIVTAMIVTPLF